MKKFSKIFNFIILGILFSLCLIGTFFKHISFGLGLGDIAGYVALYIATLTHLVFTLLLRKKGGMTHLFLALFFSVITIIFCLKATIWRGPIYSWNGQLFYVPCLQKIPVRNDDINEIIAVTMCTGDYDFNFAGKWNGNYLEVAKGNPLYPEKLKKYINLPIKFVNIETENEGIYGNPLPKDTMNINKEYYLTGQISQVTDGIPTIKLR